MGQGKSHAEEMETEFAADALDALIPKNTFLVSLVISSRQVCRLTAGFGAASSTIVTLFIPEGSLAWRS
jgi:hypothetical protein